jgi:hypothetical protein
MTVPGGWRAVPGRTRLGGRSVAVLLLGAVCGLTLGWGAAEGIRVTRTWVVGVADSDAVEERATCLARAVDLLVPPATPLSVAVVEVANLDGGVLLVNLVEHAYRRARLVERPEQADLVLGVTKTPGAGCDGYTVTVRRPDG